MDRRAFFKAFGRQILGEAPKEKKRPPGALPEEEFIQECTGCDACMIACPHDALIIDDLERRDPFLAAENSPCLSCIGKPCIPSCPTKALSDTL